MSEAKEYFEKDYNPIDNWWIINTDGDIGMSKKVLFHLMQSYHEVQPKKINCGRFSISEYPPIPDSDTNGSRNVIWIENKDGEGTTIDVDKLFELAM